MISEVRGTGGFRGPGKHRYEALLEHSPWHLAFPPALGRLSECWSSKGRDGPLGSDPAAVTPAPTQENWGPSSCLPEIVARGHIVVHIPGVQATEGVPGQAEGGGSVQVTVPLDLDTHDASLWVVSRESEQAFLGACSRMTWVEDCVREARGLCLPRWPCPGSCALRSPLFCQDGIWGRRDLLQRRKYTI